MKRKVLNAISRSYTQKHRKEAIQKLLDVYGVDYKEWCEVFKYKASPCTLLSNLNSQSNRTMYNYHIYLEGK